MRGHAQVRLEERGVRLVLTDCLSLQCQEAPTEQQIDGVVEFLTSRCNLQTEDVAKLATEFPQVFGCDVEKQLKYAVGVLENDWFMKGKILTSTLKRRPQSLGCNVDCEGSCWGKCERCWVRF